MILADEKKTVILRTLNQVHCFIFCNIYRFTLLLYR